MNKSQYASGTFSCFFLWQIRLAFPGGGGGREATVHTSVIQSHINTQCSSMTPSYKAVPAPKYKMVRVFQWHKTTRLFPHAMMAQTLHTLRHFTNLVYRAPKFQTKRTRTQKTFHSCRQICLPTTSQCKNSETPLVKKTYTFCPPNKIHIKRTIRSHRERKMRETHMLTPSITSHLQLCNVHTRKTWVKVD